MEKGHKIENSSALKVKKPWKKVENFVKKNGLFFYPGRIQRMKFKDPKIWVENSLRLGPVLPPETLTDVPVSTLLASNFIGIEHKLKKGIEIEVVKRIILSRLNLNKNTRFINKINKYKSLDNQSQLTYILSCVECYMVYEKLYRALKSIYGTSQGNLFKKLNEIDWLELCAGSTIDSPSSKVLKFFKFTHKLPDIAIIGLIKLSQHKVLPTHSIFINEWNDLIRNIISYATRDWYLKAENIFSEIYEKEINEKIERVIK